VTLNFGGYGYLVWVKVAYRAALAESVLSWCFVVCCLVSYLPGIMTFLDIKSRLMLYLRYLWNEKDDAQI